jgi:hypothetical protein
MPAVFLANVSMPPSNFVQVSFADVSKQVVQLPPDAGGGLGGSVLSIQRDQDGMFQVSLLH